MTPDRQLEAQSNLASVELEAVEDIERLRALVETHHKLTGSRRAAALLADWTAALSDFVQVMPVEYRRALAELGTLAAAE